MVCLSCITALLTSIKWASHTRSLASRRSVTPARASNRIGCMTARCDNRVVECYGHDRYSTVLHVHCTAAQLRAAVYATHFGCTVREKLPLSRSLMKVRQTKGFSSNELISFSRSVIPLFDHYKEVRREDNHPHQLQGESWP
jgi:hypothetical protein